MSSKKKSKKPDIPKCEVIIRKEAEQDGVQCKNDAEYVIQITDPDDPTHLRIVGIVLVCQKHADKFDTGHTILSRDKSGNLFLNQSADTITNSGSPPSREQSPPT